MTATDVLITSWKSCSESYDLYVVSKPQSYLAQDYHLQDDQTSPGYDTWFSRFKPFKGPVKLQNGNRTKQPILSIIFRFPVRLLSHLVSELINY